MQVKKQQLEPDMEQRTGSKLGKGYVKAVYCHPTYLTYIQSAKCEMLDWMKQAGIKTAGRNINNLRYADDTTLTAESKDQPRSPTLQVNSLPTEVQGKNFMANRWGNSGNSVRLCFSGL